MDDAGKMILRKKTKQENCEFERLITKYQNNHKNDNDNDN
jgi:hypothetical protein